MFLLSIPSPQPNTFFSYHLVLPRAQNSIIDMMNYILALLPMLAAMGTSSPIAPRQEDWDGTQTGGIFCEARLQPNWADCKYPGFSCFHPFRHRRARLMLLANTQAATS